MAETVLGSLFMLAGLFGWWVIVRRTGDSLHPLGLMTLFWLVVFGFGHWNVASVYDEAYYALPFELITYGVAIGSFLAFVFGYWLADPELPAIDQDALAARLRASVNPGRLRVLALVFFAAATATTVYFIGLSGEIPLFSPNVLDLRLRWKQPGTGYIWDLHYAVTLFATILIDRAQTRRERLFWLLIGLSSVVQLAFGAVRLSPLTAVVWASVYIFYRRLGRVKLRHLITMAAVVFALSSVIEYYRRIPLVLNPTWVNPGIDTSVPATVWSHTGVSFKNLQLSLEKHPPYLALGGMSYDLVKTLEPKFREEESALFYRYGVHNTATYLVDLYMDFGIFGLLVVPGIYGFFTALVYRQFRGRGSVFWLIIQIDFLIAVVLAFRTHRFFGNTLIVSGAVGALTQLFAGVPQDAGAHDRPESMTSRDLVLEGVPTA